MDLLLLPINLYDKKYLPNNIKTITIYEHPQYFTKYNFNKKKLLLHRASMKEYYDYLHKHYNVIYVNYNKKLKKKQYTIFDPIDNIDFDIIVKETLESPNFLLNKTIYEIYTNKKRKTDKVIFNNFYMFGKKEINIIPNMKSQDKDNRKKIPKNLNIPNLPKINNESKYITSAKKYIENNFKDNYGSVDNFVFPTNHEDAKKFLNNFIKNRFEKFGNYQDYTLENNNYLFHSCLSSSINIGLIQPSEIIEKIRPLEKTIPKNSYEGYIRQLFWREYQRYCYIYFDFNTDYFNNKKKLDNNWYNGTLGILPVDHAIKIGFETGYLHHIYRLMIIGNFMNLSEISPMEGLRWFMEFSCDSYEWVMYQNVLDMVFFVTGGKTMRKPYISSSNYIKKMSDFKKGEWCDTWDDMYRSFIKKHKDKLWNYRYHFPTLTKKN